MELLIDIEADAAALNVAQAGVAVAPEAALCVPAQIVFRALARAREVRSAPALRALRELREINHKWLSLDEQGVAVARLADRTLRLDRLLVFS